GTRAKTGGVGQETRIARRPETQNVERLRGTQGTGQSTDATKGRPDEPLQRNAPRLRAVRERRTPVVEAALRHAPPDRPKRPGQSARSVGRAGEPRFSFASRPVRAARAQGHRRTQARRGEGG